jgi:hypothetical protein
VTAGKPIDVARMFFDLNYARGVLNADQELTYLRRGNASHGIAVDLFNEASEDVKLLDAYDGVMPLVLNARTLAASQPVNLKALRFVLVDSNVASAMRRFVQGERLDVRTQRSMELLFAWVHESELNVLPAFAASEAIASTRPDLMSEFVRADLEAALYFAGADYEVHRGTGRFILGRAARLHLIEVYGTDDPREASQKIFDMLPKVYEEDLNATEAYLAEALAIRHDTRIRGFAAKADAFLSVIDGFGRLLSEELHVALHLFAGLADGFLPFDPKIRREKLLGRLRAASWDVMLLRYPEMLLAQSDVDCVPVAVVATADRFVQLFAGLRAFGAVLARRQLILQPLIGFSPELLYEILEDDEVTIVLQQVQEYVQTRPSITTLTPVDFGQYRDAAVARLLTLRT